MSEIFSGGVERIPNNPGSGCRQEGKHTNASSNEGHDERPAHVPHMNQALIRMLVLKESLMMVR